MCFIIVVYNLVPFGRKILVLFTYELLVNQTIDAHLFVVDFLFVSFYAVVVDKLWHYIGFFFPF